MCNQVLSQDRLVKWVICAKWHCETLTSPTRLKIFLELSNIISRFWTAGTRGFMNLIFFYDLFRKTMFLQSGVFCFTFLKLGQFDSFKKLIWEALEKK
jgi:hypothetical protein